MGEAHLASGLAKRSKSDSGGEDGAHKSPARVALEDMTNMQPASSAHLCGAALKKETFRSRKRPLPLEAVESMATPSALRRSVAEGSSEKPQFKRRRTLCTLRTSDQHLSGDSQSLIRGRRGLR